MNSLSGFLLVMGSLGAFAEPQPNSFQPNTFNGGYCSSLPVVNAHIQTSVVENPTVTFPSFPPPTAISESCHCFNTLVRPQIHNEIITTPTVDRIVRTVSTPIVETINCGGGTRLTTFAGANNFLSAIIGSRSFSRPVTTNNLSSSGRDNSRLFNEKNQRVFFTNYNNNGATPNGIDIGVIASPTFFTLPSTPGENPKETGKSGSTLIRK